MKIVHALAQALDADDYATAETLLESDAVYETDETAVHGSLEILESFRKTSEWGRRNLDALEFSHEIDDKRAPLDIVFLDILRYAGEELRLQHAMRVVLSDRGLVRNLRLIPPADEAALVREFFQRHGLSRD